jgi:hypothetical protein
VSRPVVGVAAKAFDNQATMWQPPAHTVIMGIGCSSNAPYRMPCLRQHAPAPPPLLMYLQVGKVLPDAGVAAAPKAHI